MYATTADMKARYEETELLDLAPNDSGDAIDDAKLEAALSDAQAEINSYLAARYGVPVTGAEPLKAVACDLARYQLYDTQATDEVARRYTQRITWLKDVAAGRATLGVAERDSSPKLALAVRRTGQDRIFTREHLERH